MPPEGSGQYYVAELDLFGMYASRWNKAEIAR